jgi:hypothetical protein
MNEKQKLEQLRRQVAASENPLRLCRLLREAERLEDGDLVTRVLAKIAKLHPGKLPLGGPCPQIRMVVTPWVADENGVLGREVFAEDVPTTL